MVLRFYGFLVSEIPDFHFMFQEDIGPTSKTFKILSEGYSSFPGARLFNLTFVGFQHFENYKKATFWKQVGGFS